MSWTVDQLPSNRVFVNWLMRLTFVFVLGCALLLQTASSALATDLPVAVQRVGGWYPVFFDQYEQEKIDKILESVKQGRVAALSIQTDLNQELANRISDALVSGCQCVIQTNTLHQSSTETVQFAHHRVSVRVQTK